MLSTTRFSMLLLLLPAHRCFQFKALFQDIVVFCLQAEKASWNSIGIFKISNVSGKRRELLPNKPEKDDADMDSDSSDSDEDSEDEEDGGSKAPILQVLC